MKTWIVFWMHTLVSWIVPLSIVKGHKCIFDSVSPKKDILVKSVKYDDGIKRFRRSPSDLYHRIRITPLFYDLHVELTPGKVQQLKNVANQAVRKATDIFSVIPVSSPLLLSRDACGVAWTSGPNKGKCQRISKGYVGEICLNVMRIPDAHLEGLDLYNGTYDEPIYRAFPEGKGVANTDFILYIKATTTQSVCLARGNVVVAYAGHCQVDDQGRPVAGVINFCPAQLRNETQERLVLIALHELFHLLGFSKNLFPLYRDCSSSSSGLNCSDYEGSILRTTKNVDRLITPLVLAATQRHFNCFTQEDFGGPLQSEGSALSSHWKASMMQGSLMAPEIGQAHLTFLDSITLAAFEDSGWYKVDYTQSDHYIWGQGTGCSFGMDTTCRKEDSEYFCLQKNFSGCHYLHRDKATCAGNKYLNHCKVYTSKPGDECFLPNAVGRNSQREVSGESFTAHSRCFLSNITRQNAPSSILLVGRCYQQRCRNNVLSVKLPGSQWVPCSAGSNIQIPGYAGVISCPDILVNECTMQVITIHPVTLQDATQTMPARTTKIINDDVLTVELVFENASYDILREKHLIKEFHDAVITTLILRSDLTRDRIYNVDVLPGCIIVVFDILKGTSQDLSPQNIYSDLTLLVKQGNFTVIIKSTGESFIASNIRLKVRATPDRHDDGRKLGAGGIVGIVIGILIAVGLLITAFVLVHKYKHNHQHVEPATDIEMSNLGQRHGAQEENMPRRLNMIEEDGRGQISNHSFTKLDQVMSQSSMENI